MVVLASDGFFIPLTPDRFCSQAVRVLGRVLTEWIKRHEEISKTFEPFKLKPFPGKPCFLGAVIQNFKVHSGTSPKVSYQRWQEKINDGLKTSVLDNSKIPLRAGLDVKNPFIASTNLGDQIAFSWSRTTPIEAIRRRWSIYLQLAYLENLQWAWDALKLRSHRSFIILLLSNANGFEQIKLPIESTKKVEALYLVAASAAVGALWFTGWQWEPTLYGAWLLNHPDSPLNAEGS